MQALEVVDGTASINNAPESAGPNLNKETKSFEEAAVEAAAAVLVQEAWKQHPL